MFTFIFALLLIQQPIIPDQPITVMVGSEPVKLIYTSEGDEYVTITPVDRTDEGTLDLIIAVRYGTDHLVYHDLDAIPALEDLLLSKVGDYTITLHTFNGVQTGAVEVTLTTRPRLMMCEPVEIELAAHTPYTCWLDLEASQQLTITARDVSGTLDPVLRLYIADELLVLNDDHGMASIELNVFDAALLDFTVPASARYRVQVSDFAGATGTVELSLDRAG